MEKILAHCVSVTEMMLYWYRCIKRVVETTWTPIIFRPSSTRISKRAMVLSTLLITCYFPRCRRQVYRHRHRHRHRHRLLPQLQPPPPIRLQAQQDCPRKCVRRQVLRSTVCTSRVQSTSRDRVMKLPSCIKRWYPICERVTPTGMTDCTMPVSCGINVPNEGSRPLQQRRWIRTTLWRSICKLISPSASIIGISSIGMSTKFWRKIQRILMRCLCRPSTVPKGCCPPSIRLNSQPSWSICTKRCRRRRRGLISFMPITRCCGIMSFSIRSRPGRSTWTCADKAWTGRSPVHSFPILNVC
mmetsp:Transcript_60389/g.67533  ORF Transcript_60389/g.67533 Transcript_60389/m.67533 type:complete len:300 (-) Transcript_60389:986-1885(-)